jgi:hypothetical protein
MFVEYDWTFNVYRFRFGADVFTDFRGFRSADSLADIKAILALGSCKLGKKTDDRTWAVVVA